MTRLRGMFVRLRKSEDGATMIEYSILVGIITAITIGLIVAMGDFVQEAWTVLCDNAESGTEGVEGFTFTCP